MYNKKKKPKKLPNDSLIGPPIGGVIGYPSRNPFSRYMKTLENYLPQSRENWRYMKTLENLPQADRKDWAYMRTLEKLPQKDRRVKPLQFEDNPAAIIDVTSNAFKELNPEAVYYLKKNLTKEYEKLYGVPYHNGFGDQMPLDNHYNEEVQNLIDEVDRGTTERLARQVEYDRLRRKYHRK